MLYQAIPSFWHGAIVFVRRNFHSFSLSVSAFNMNFAVERHASCDFINPVSDSNTNLAV